MTLGSIIVRLSMQTADFETDAGRASKVAEKRAKEIDAAFRKAGAAIGVALGAAITGVGVAVKGAIDRMDELSKSAQRVGMPTEDFSRLAYAGELADVSMETLVSSLGKLTKSQAAALKETSEQARVFDALGISVKNADGSLRSSNDVLLDFADRFKALDGSPEAMAAGFSLFGRSFQDLIPLLKGGSEGLREAAAESDAFGKTVSSEAGKAAEDFNDNITRLQSALGGAAIEIASGMLPQLNAMTGELVASAKETDKLREFGEGLVTVLGAIGQTFGFVSGMARQFGVDMGAAIEAAAGLAQVYKNIPSFGIADGTISGGFDKIVNAWKTRKQLMDEARRQQANAADANFMAGPSVMSPEQALASLDGVPANGTGTYNGPALIPSKALQDADLARKAAAIKEARAQAEALRKALGDPDPKAGKPASAKLSEEEQGYRRLSQAMSERIGLFGAETEEAKLNYEITSGALKNLSQAKKDELLLQARQLDALNAEKEARKAAADAAKDQTEADLAHKAAIEGVLSDYETEFKLLGMSRLEQEKYIALKRAGVDAWSEEGKAITDWIDKVHGAREARDELHGFQTSLEDAFAAVLDGSKSVGDAFENMFDDLRRQAAAFIAEKAIQKLFDWLFGAKKADGTDVVGSLFGSLFGLKGFSSGGYTGDGPRNEIAGVVHRGEYVISASMLNSMRNSRVIPATAGLAAPVAGDGGGATYVNVINNSGQPAQVTERMDGMNKIVDVIVGEVDRRIARNGSTGKAIGQRFGLQPVGVTRG